MRQQRKAVDLMLLISLFTGMRCAAQTHVGSRRLHNNMQYGVSLKASLLFDLRSQHPNPYFRLGADIGVASTFITDWIYPAVNLESQLYNGGLGTRNREGNNFGWDFEFLPAFTLTAGWTNRFKGDLTNARYINLYYFSNFARPALQNPFDHSVSVGTVFSLVTDTAKRSQRIGFLDFNIAGGFQLSYYNDGAFPFGETLGDGNDRYHTGGGLLSYNGERHTFITDIELAYHKYTGFSKSSFGASNKTFFAFMDYHDPEQKQFNRSQYDLNIGNPFRGYALQVQGYNSVRWDLQHNIHTAVLNTYHMVPYSPAYITIGLSYHGLTQNVGVR